MFKLIRFPFLCCLSLGLGHATLHAQAAKEPPAITVTTDHADALYKQGETVTFQIQLPDASPLPKNAELNWEISKDGVSPITTGKIKLADGKASFTGKLEEPGFLHSKVTAIVDGKPAHQAQAGAGIDPLLIKPSLPVPDDFDAFWDAQKKKLAAVPMNPQLTPVTTTAVKDAECFDVKLDCVGTTPVSGYFAKPSGAKPKSLPVILLVQGAGVRSSGLNSAAYWCKNGLLAMDINAHGIANGQPDAFYTDLQQGALKDYPHQGNESRETCYFLNMFLREVRALDFLTSQPEWDGKTVIVQGSSQGGFQAFAAAAIDPRVTFFAAGVPAGCDHSGSVAKRINGWPRLVPNGPDGQPDAKALEVSRYFDNVNFAAHTKAKGAYVTTGFIDVTCPPTTVYAAYNNLPIAKNIYNDIPCGHAMSPASGNAMTQAVLDYVKSVK
ncbi:acetylxylan esterase [soil metagenome]